MNTSTHEQSGRTDITDKQLAAISGLLVISHEHMTSTATVGGSTVYCTVTPVTSLQMNESLQRDKPGQHDHNEGSESGSECQNDSGCCTQL